MTSKTATLAELQNIIKELATSQKKTEKSHRKTEETLRELAEVQKKSREEMEKSHERMEISSQKADKRLRELDELFNGQWGKLMEALVKGDLIKLLKERNIDVTGIAKEHERRLDGETYEFDIIATNGDEVVVVEVKTTLGKKDVDHFIIKLKDFKKIFREYADKKIFGAVAYLKENSGSVKYSMRKKLFVIRATGSSSSILNDKRFRPKVF